MWSGIGGFSNKISFNRFLCVHCFILCVGPLALSFFALQVFWKNSNNVRACVCVKWFLRSKTSLWECKIHLKEVKWTFYPNINVKEASTGEV